MVGYYLQFLGNRNGICPPFPIQRQEPDVPKRIGQGERLVQLAGQRQSIFRTSSRLVWPSAPSQEDGAGNPGHHSWTGAEPEPHRPQGRVEQCDGTIQMTETSLEITQVGARGPGDDMALDRDRHIPLITPQFQKSLAHFGRLLKRGHVHVVSGERAENREHRRLGFCQRRQLEGTLKLLFHLGPKTTHGHQSPGEADSKHHLLAVPLR